MFFMLKHLVIPFIISLIITVYFKWTYEYWKRKRLNYLPPKRTFGLLFGSGQKDHFAIRFKKMYNVMKEKGWKHGGLYGFLEPVYMPIDLDIIKNIMAKDFHYFTDRGLYRNEKTDPLTGHIFNLNGFEWKNMRIKLTPAFTSSKLKFMFQTALDCAINLQKRMEFASNAPVDIKEILSNYVVDVIASCALGSKVFQENASFQSYKKRFFKENHMKQSLVNTFPKLCKAFNVSLMSKHTNDFFINILKDTITYREQNNIHNKDFLQFLLESENCWTFEEMSAQIYMFFVAGIETSLSLMVFALYELAKNQQIQENLRNEIKSVHNENNITYESAQEMKYLNQVIDETVRKYPPGPLVTRRCVQDYKIRGSNVVIEKGVLVLIPIMAIHHDPEYYPEPEKFDPDRFTKGNKSLRHSYAHIPFGAGQRKCIGMRFGLDLAKVGLISLLKECRFTVNENTKEPLVMNPSSVILTAKDNIWLNVHKE